MQHQIEAYCDCGHSSILDLQALMDRYGPEYVLTEKSIVCASCGAGGRLSVSHRQAGKGNLRWGIN